MLVIYLFFMFCADNLKVIEVCVEPGISEQLYETGAGEVYIRRDGGVQGPLKASAIQDWTKMVGMVQGLPMKGLWGNTGMTP